MALEKTNERIIIMAPIGSDAEKIASLLRGHHFEACICFNFEDCCREIKRGAGTLLFTEEALELSNVPDFLDILKAQPTWSELPLIILSSGGESQMIRLLDVTLQAAGSITLLERPISTLTLLRSIEVALRSRRRQYQVRDLIETIAKNNKALQQFASIIESSDDAIISKDLNGIITSWNRGAQRIFGYKAEEVIGKSIMILFPKDRQSEEPAILKRIIEGERIDHYDTVRQRKDGSLVDVSLTISPIKDTNGVIIGASTIGRDITARKKAEDDLKMFASILEERVTERTHLLEEQTNRLRQLAVELTEVEQKERRRLAEVLHDHLQQFLVAAKLRLDLMEQKTIEIDKLSIVEARHYIEEAIDASRQLTAELRPPVLYEGGLSAGLRFLAKKMESQHKLKVNLSILGDIEPGSDLIKVMVYQCVQELLFNTVKHANVQECSVEVARQENQDIKLTIADKGLGFNASNLEVAKTGGFGLFSIRERVKALGGELKISSASGQGSVFTITIPDKVTIPAEDVTYTPKERLFTRERSEKEGIVVLIADDHSIVRQAIASLLLSQTFIKEVIQATNGEEAIHKAEVTDPDIILMDVNMPKINGVEATQILSHSHSRAKIIGLSIQPASEMMQTMKDAGAVAYLNKGDDTGHLIETIKRFAPRQFASTG